MPSKYPTSKSKSCRTTSFPTQLKIHSCSSSLLVTCLKPSNRYTLYSFFFFGLMTFSDSVSARCETEGGTDADAPWNCPWLVWVTLTLLPQLDVKPLLSEVRTANANKWRLRAAATIQKTTESRHSLPLVLDHVRHVKQFYWPK